MSALYKINYKSDFVLTINSDAGWAVPFCIKFWTGMPSHGYFAGFDGENYVNCRVGETPTQLLVMFDDHHMPIGELKMQIAYHTTIEEFPDREFDEVTNPVDVTVDIDGTEYQVMLDFTGESGAEIDFSMPSSGVMSVNGKIGYVTLTAEDVGAQPTIEDLSTIRSGAAAGATAVQPATLQEGLATKQNVIEDLSTIRNGAAAGATAIQPATLQEGLAGKQDTISDLATIRSGAAAGATAVQPAALTPIENDIDAIEGKIPSAASASNQLADKAFVNSALSSKADAADIPTALSQLSQDSTHRVVTDTEKATWNGKQNAIDDLATIRSGAAAGATAVQPAALQEGLAGKQDTISDLAEIRSGASAGATAVQPTALQEGLAGKQDVISDLSTIRSGAAAGATAVQPAAMNTALAEKQDTLTFDNAPTANSNNPVKSSGIKTALDAKQSTISTVNVTVDNNTGTPSGSASVSGSTLSLNFQNLKGATGATGATGPQGPQGERGLPGESGVTGDVSGFTVIQTIDPSATYGATDIAGAATVQATNAELTELSGELYGKEKNLMDNVTTQPSKVYITADMVTAGEVLVFELESINNLQGALKAEKTGLTHDRYIICPAGQSATVEYTVPADFLRIFTRSTDNPMLVKSCSSSIQGDIDEIKERLDELEEGTIITTEDIEDGAVTSPKMADNAVTTEKISDTSVTRSKLSADVKDTIASPFSLDGNAIGNTKCIPELTIYTTNADDVNHNYYLQRLMRVDGSVYITVQQDTTNVAAIDIRSSFTPTTNRSIFSVGMRTDNTLIAKIVVDWAQLTDGINLTPRWKIKSENIVLVGNMNALNVRLYNGVLSYINEAITDIDMRLLSDEEHDAPYRLYNLNKSATNLSFRLYRGSAYTFIETALTTGNEIVKCGAYGVTLTFDCSKIPNGYSSGIAYCADIVKRTKVEYNDATDGYLQKDTIIDVFMDVFYVDCNRTSNSGQWFKSISEACAHVRSISPNKHQKQFEIVVMPGVYHECGILVPPYTHIHGTSKDAVVVTDTDYSGDDHSCFFDFGTAGQVAWHSDGRYGKLSNMTLRETQGRYCIHASQPYMCGLLENIAFEHYLCTTGPRANLNFVIGVGCGYSGNLFTFDGCSFKSFGHRGKVTGHTVRLTTYGNCRLNFRNCLFVNTNLSYGSIGSCGNLIIEIEGCSFINGSELLAEFTANAIQPYQYLSDLYEINFIGSNNKHLVANLPCDGAAVCVEKDTPSQGDTLYIKGSIVDALFGGVNYKNGGTSVTAKAIGSLYVADAKNASNADVFQMWKRLGDCSTTAKTMSVSINGGTEQVVTLSGNYASTKPAESSIIAEINAQLSGVTFKKFNVTDRYSKLNTSEKELIFMQQDIAKFACVDKDGVICNSGSTDVHGIVLEDTAINDVAPVWTGYGIYTGMADGDYAVGTNGTLVISSSNVVFTCSSGVLLKTRDN